jgi:hypothetical protein
MTERLAVSLHGEPVGWITRGSRRERIEFEWLEGYTPGPVTLTESFGSVRSKAPSAALGEPLALAALKRVSPEEAARRGRRRLQPDRPERLRQRDRPRGVSVGPLKFDALPPGAAGNPADLLAMQTDLEPVGHQRASSAAGSPMSNVTLRVMPSDFSVRSSRVMYTVLRPASSR